jgi:hypothetical protein
MSDNIAYACRFGPDFFSPPPPGTDSDSAPLSSIVWLDAVQNSNSITLMGVLQTCNMFVGANWVKIRLECDPPSWDGLRHPKVELTS